MIVSVVVVVSVSIVIVDVTGSNVVVVAIISIVVDWSILHSGSLRSHIHDKYLRNKKSSIICFYVVLT